MKRRVALKTAGATSASMFGFAGCLGSNESSNGDEGGSDGDSDEPEDESTDGGSDGDPDEPEDGSTDGVPDAEGTVAENTIDGLEIVDLSSSSGSERPTNFNTSFTTVTDQYFLVTATIENTGDTTTNPLDYQLALQLFDSNGDPIDTLPTAGGVTAENPTEIDPGETVEITVFKGLTGYEPPVSSYELVLACEESFWSAADYCDSAGTSYYDNESEWFDAEAWESDTDGRVVENNVSGLELTGWETQRTDGSYWVKLVVENEGDRSTTLTNYAVDIELFADDGEKLPYHRVSASPVEEIEPGGEGSLIYKAEIIKHYPPISSIEVSLQCTDSGTYCNE